MNIVNLCQSPQHLETLANWHHQEWQAINPGRSLQDRIDDYQEYLNDSFVPSTFVAVENNRVLGSASIIECDMDSHPEFSPWMASVFVAPEHRKKGIGSCLIERLSTEAKLAGYKQLYLFTEDQQDWYQRLGWDMRFKEAYRGHKTFVMQKNLA